jgi:hypothetical protein
LAHELDWHLRGNRDGNTAIPNKLTLGLLKEFGLPSAISLLFDIRVKIPVTPDRPSRFRSDFTSACSLLLEQIFAYPHVQRLFKQAGATFGTESPDPCRTPKEFNQLREHTIVVGSICSQLQRSFGTSLIFSLKCKGQWKRLIESPAYFFFRDNKNSRVVGVHLLAEKMIASGPLAMQEVSKFIDEVLDEPIKNSELLEETNAPVSSFGFVSCLGSENFSRFRQAISTARELMIM